MPRFSFIRRAVATTCRLVALAGFLGVLPAVGAAGGPDSVETRPDAGERRVTPAVALAPVGSGTRGHTLAPRHGVQQAAGCDPRRCGHGRCTHGACRNGGCEVVGCPAHCPVRPATFGYYGTQWRTWPGHDVELATYTERAAPVMPPKSEVPTAEEESPVPAFEPPPAEHLPSGREDREEGRRSEDQPRKAKDDGGEDDLEMPVKESAPPPPAEPAARPAAEPAKPAAPAKPKADGDDNLFDDAAARRRAQQRLATLRNAAILQEQLRQEAVRQRSLLVRRPNAPHIDEVIKAAYAERAAAAERAAEAERIAAAAAAAEAERQAKAQARTEKPGASGSGRKQSVRQAGHAVPQARPVPAGIAPAGVPSDVKGTARHRPSNPLR